MWYIVFIVVSNVLVIVFSVMLVKHERLIFGFLIFVFGFYSVVSTTVIGTSPGKETIRKSYIDAKYKCEILKTDMCLPIKTVSDFKDDIDNVNSTIDRHRKYCDNWYLKAFHYKEIGDLQKLNCDTINVKITTN